MAKIRSKVEKLSKEQKDLSDTLEAHAQLLASAELLSDHPELRWEQAASNVKLPQLGIAKSLFAKDKKLSQFKR